MQMQSELTAVLDTIASQTKAVEIDKEEVEKKLEQAIQSKDEAIAVLQSMLVILGVRHCHIVSLSLVLFDMFSSFYFVTAALDIQITEEEMSKLYDLNRIGSYLQNGITRMKAELHAKYCAPDEVIL